MIKITANPPRPRLTARFRPFLKLMTRKISWDASDRRDTATSAYVAIRRYLAKAEETEEGEVEVWMSNDSGRALQYELRRFIDKAPRDAIPNELTRLLVLIDEGFDAQERRENERQQAERDRATRRGSTSVRQRRGLH